MLQRVVLIIILPIIPYIKCKFGKCLLHQNQTKAQMKMSNRLLDKWLDALKHGRHCYKTTQGNADTLCSWGNSLLAGKVESQARWSFPYKDPSMNGYCPRAAHWRRITLYRRLNRKCSLRQFPSRDYVLVCTLTNPGWFGWT